jgi:alanine racemase
MGPATLSIDLDAVAANWRALARAADGAATGAVVKADAYGLGADRVAPVLAAAGAKQFFVALAGEGVALRRILGPGPEIFVFGGHMAGDRVAIDGAGLIPLLNSPDQARRHFEALPAHPFGVQLDTGMARLGFAPADFVAMRPELMAARPRLAMSHLACADDPDDPMNAAQLRAFRDLTDGLAVPRSLAATGGILLGPAYHFDLIRPGIGLYGGQPFTAAQPVVGLTVPVIQTRDLTPGMTVGYGASWTAARPTRLATIRPGIRANSGCSCCISAGFSLPVVGLTALFTGGALALQIYAGGARFNAEAVVPSDRRHRHGARAGPGAGRADGGRPRRRLDRRRDRHDEGDRTDRRAGHAVDQPDEIPHRAARAGRHPVAAGAGRDRRHHRHHGRLSGRGEPARLQRRRLSQQHARISSRRPT